MSGVLRRRVNTTSVFNIQHGKAAAILPPAVTRIHMDFAKEMKAGHVGSKKFWREYLPSLKYHNPSIPMIVNRREDVDGPAVMSVYIRQPGATGKSNTTATKVTSSNYNMSKAPEPAEDERLVTIDMKSKHSDEILTRLLTETDAQQLVPSKEEKEKIAKLEEERQQLEAARELSEKMALAKAKSKKKDQKLIDAVKGVSAGLA